MAAAQTGPVTDPPADVTAAQAVAGATAAVAVALVSEAPTNTAVCAVRARGAATAAPTTAIAAANRTMTGTATMTALAGATPTIAAAAATATATCRSLTAGLRRPATGTPCTSSSGVPVTAPLLDAGPTMGQPRSPLQQISVFGSGACLPQTVYTRDQYTVQCTCQMLNTAVCRYLQTYSDCPSANATPTLSPEVPFSSCASRSSVKLYLSMPPELEAGLLEPDTLSCMERRRGTDWRHKAATAQAVPTRRLRRSCPTARPATGQRPRPCHPAP